MTRTWRLHPLAGLPSRGFTATAVSQAPWWPEGVLNIRSLCDGQGKALEEAWRRAGQSVQLRGYLSSTNRRNLFLLSSDCGAICQMCGATHNPGSNVNVRFSNDEMRRACVMDIVQVRGILSVRQTGPFGSFNPQVDVDAGDGHIVGEIQ